MMSWWNRFRTPIGTTMTGTAIQSDTMAHLLSGFFPLRFCHPQSGRFELLNIGVALYIGISA